MGDVVVWLAAEEALPQLLYGWRQKKHYRKRETNKGWLKTEDATSLIQYALNDRVKITFAHFATFIV